MSAMAASQIGAQLAPHAPALVMIPLIGLSVLLVLIAIIVLAAAKNKMPGYLMLGLGLLLGGGAFAFMFFTERRKAAAVTGAAYGGSAAYSIQDAYADY